MHLMHPPRHHDGGQPSPRHRGLGAWLRDRHVTRFEVGCVAAFHFGVALILIFWDRDQVITPGTSAIFGTVPLPVWAAGFLLTGISAALATWRTTSLRLSLTWCGVFPLGLAWTYGFAVAVTSGRGNAIFAFGWSFLLIWWFTTAVRMSIGGSETRWGGG